MQTGGLRYDRRHPDSRQEIMMRLSPTLQRTTVYAVFFLFFFQLLADFVEAIYAFLSLIHI